MNDPLTNLRRIVLAHVPEPHRAEALEALDAIVAATVTAHREIDELNGSVRFHVRAVCGLLEKLDSGGQL